MAKALNRREMLKVMGLGTAGVILGASPALATVQTSSSCRSIHIIDARLKPRPRCASSIQTILINGDITTSWFSQIKPFMLEGNVFVLGRTLGDALFCLRELSQDLGWRVDSQDANNFQSVHGPLDPTQSYDWIFYQPNNQIYDGEAV